MPPQSLNYETPQHEPRRRILRWLATIVASAVITVGGLRFGYYLLGTIVTFFRQGAGGLSGDLFHECEVSAVPLTLGIIVIVLCWVRPPAA
jgi:hypothetical protein